MNDKKRSPLLYLFFFLLGAAVLNAALLLVRASATGTVAVSVLYYACSLLSLLATMAGVGAALYYLSRGLGGVACRVMLITQGTALLPLLVAAVRTAFDYPDYFTDALVTEILAALGNTLLTTGIYLFLLLICYALYFRRGIVTGAPALRPLRGNRPAFAALTFAGVLFIYQLIAETVNTVDFLVTYWPNVYRNEIGSIVFSYIYILLSFVLGLFIQYATQALLHESIEQ